MAAPGYLTLNQWTGLNGLVEAPSLGVHGGTVPFFPTAIGPDGRRMFASPPLSLPLFLGPRAASARRVWSAEPVCPSSVAENRSGAGEGTGRRADRHCIRGIALASGGPTPLKECGRKGQDCVCGARVPGQHSSNLVRGRPNQKKTKPRTEWGCLRSPQAAHNVKPGPLRVPSQPRVYCDFS